MTSPPSASAFHFSSAVTQWQVMHGRHGLPWQGTRDPYPVWLSEIMLQQTQVGTVLGYFSRFLQRFPTVKALAQANQVDVLALWSGLGYYSRARNLHRCAQAIVQQHGGQFPRTAAALQALPGIGPSTAAAIAAFCFSEPVSIYDGNVKRVLARFLGFENDLSVPGHDRQLHQVAQTLVPTTQLEVAMPRYTQGLMDLGATICTRTKPSCLLCPLQQACVAQRSPNPARLPVKSRRLQRSTQAWFLLFWQHPDGRIWLQERPPKGIWAALFCPQVFTSEAELQSHAQSQGGGPLRPLMPFTHSLTHRDLALYPFVCPLPTGSVNAADTRGCWTDATLLPQLGVPAPVAKLVAQLLGAGYQPA